LLLRLCRNAATSTPDTHWSGSITKTNAKPDLHKKKKEGFYCP